MSYKRANEEGGEPRARKEKYTQARVIKITWGMRGREGRKDE